MAQGAHKITEIFEEELCRYTGAPYCVCVDNASNALFLSLMYEGVKGQYITIPRFTYPSVPCEIIHAGAYVSFWDWYDKEGYLEGAYNLAHTRTWDSALRFTCDMYRANTFMCLSFTGPFKRLKLSKGGAILTDDVEAYLWFKRMRFSGRRECSYHDDKLDSIGWNFYMIPELAARGLAMMPQFYDLEGYPIPQPDLKIKYPDLSKFEIYTKYNEESIDDLFSS